MKGTGEYPQEWPIIADAVKLVARYQCARCNARHSPSTYHIMTVHHLDGDKGNARWYNLAPLCQRCHLSIQAKVVMERPWLFDHSEWFKPYVAGFLAANQHYVDHITWSRDWVLTNQALILNLFGPNPHTCTDSWAPGHYRDPVKEVMNGYEQARQEGPDRRTYPG